MSLFIFPSTCPGTIIFEQQCNSFYNELIGDYLNTKIDMLSSIIRLNFIIENCQLYIDKC